LDSNEFPAQELLKFQEKVRLKIMFAKIIQKFKKKEGSKIIPEALGLGKAEENFSLRESSRRPGKEQIAVTPEELGEYQQRVKREPSNPDVHLKLAKIYEQKGEKQKAIAEYFLVAEIFFKKGFYPHAMEIYKLILGWDQSLDLVSLKIANTYQKMDLWEDAFSHYSQLLHYYQERGLKDKAREIMDLMAEFEQKKFKPDEGAYLKYRLVKEFAKLQEEEKGMGGSPRAEKEEFFDLGAELETRKSIEFKGSKEISMEKIFGFDEILKELKRTVAPGEIYPNLNYHMGLASLEMGFIDEAIVQFQMAIERGQNPFEAARLLDTCFTKKGSEREISQSRGKISKEKAALNERVLEIQVSRVPTTAL
jgi:tetratricopeptide (TPR) repeat protein